MSFLYGSRDMCIYSKDLGLKLIHKLFSWVYTLGGAGNKPNFIWNQNVFTLTVEHGTGGFGLKI